MRSKTAAAEGGSEGEQLQLDKEDQSVNARLASHDLAVSLQRVCGRIKKDGGKLRQRRLRKTTDCRVSVGAGSHTQR